MRKVTGKIDSNEASAKMRVVREVGITPPNFHIAEFEVIGTAPYVQHAFGKKTETEMKAKHMAGDKGARNSKKNRPPKDFDAYCIDATHWLPSGAPGIPVTGIKASLVSACRLAGFKMTIAKQALHVIEDDFSERGKPLVKIFGPYKRHDEYVRNDNGQPDIRARHMWRKWRARIRIRYDADQFTLTDVSNLLMRAGIQVGWGEGRPDSKKSLCGMGWGTFEIKRDKA